MFDLLKFINHNKKINGKGVYEVYGTYYHLTHLAIWEILQSLNQENPK